MWPVWNCSSAITIEWTISWYTPVFCSKSSCYQRKTFIKQNQNTNISRTKMHCGRELDTCYQGQRFVTLKPEIHNIWQLLSKVIETDFNCSIWPMGLSSITTLDTTLHKPFCRHMGGKDVIIFHFAAMSRYSSTDPYFKIIWKLVVFNMLTPTASPIPYGVPMGMLAIATQ